MRVACLAAVSALAAMGQNASTPEKILSRIEGHIYRADTGAPLGKATLSLERLDSQGPGDWLKNYEAVSDGEGAFTLAGIALGKYRLRASRRGFLDARYGAKGGSANGAVIDLESPQTLKDVDFRLMAYGVVTGRIVDTDGDPVQGAKVEILRSHYVRGKKALSPDAELNTNDLGEFRGAGLKPGRYFVRAEEFYGVAGLATAKEMYVPVFYPGVIDRTGAAPVDVTAGAQIQLGDITLRRAPTVKARGKVVVEIAGTSGRPQVTFERDTGVAGSGSFRMTPGNVGDSGEFEVQNLTPGRYTAMAQVGKGGVSRVSATVTVDVGAVDLEGIALRIRDAIVTKAAVRMEGGATMNWAGVRWMLRRGGPAGDGSEYEWGSSVAADGTFQIEEENPAHYGVFLNHLPDGYYVKSVRVGESDITYTGFDLGDGPMGTLDILVSRKASTVAGVVQNADGSQAIIGATVVLAPEAKERAGIPEYYPVATSDQFGRFSLKSVPPGDYRAYAWEEVEATAWLDPEFMKAFEKDGEALKVEEGGQANVTVKVAQEPRK